MKFRSIFNHLSSEIKITLRTFPATAALIILISIILSIVIDQKDQNYQFLLNTMLPFLILWGPGAFLSEVYFPFQKKIRWAFIGFFAAPALLFVFLAQKNDSTFWSIAADPNQYQIARAMLAWWIILLVFGIYGSYRKSGFLFSHFLTRVIENITKIGIIAAVLSAGVSLISLIFIFLILDGKNYDSMIRSQLLINSSVIGIGFLSSLHNLREKISNFFSIIVKYILCILLIVAFAIIYLYIARIFITQIIPSNEIFRIIAALFTIGLPIWTMAGYFSEDNLLTKITKRLPYSFIPFLGLQAYSIGIRIFEYGLTPLRYLCVVMIIFEAAYILLYWLKKGQTELILIIFSIFTLFALLLPGLNMFSSSIHNQHQSLNKINTAPFEQWTPEEQRRIAGAYFFLKDSNEAKKILGNFSAEQISSIENSVQFQKVFNQERNFVHQFTLDGIDIQDFRSLSEINYYSNQEPVTLNAVPFTNVEEKSVITVDMSNLFQEFLAVDPKDEQKMAELSNRLVTKEGDTIYFSLIQFSTDDEGKIVYAFFDGILLKQ